MKTTDAVRTFTSEAGSALGRGIIAGLAGTLAITVSQMIEMKLTKREQSNTPAEAASKVLEIKPATPEAKEKLTYEIHWMYGTLWGIMKAALSRMGLKGWPSTLLHFGAVYGTALVMLPSLKVAPPVKKWGAKAIAIDALHHVVYATIAGLVYDQIDTEKKN